MSGYINEAKLLQALRRAKKQEEKNASVQFQPCHKNANRLIEYLQKKKDSLKTTLLGGE